MSFVLEIGPEAAVALVLPAVVWAWGCALEQLAIGVERLARARHTLQREGRDR